MKLNIIVCGRFHYHNYVKFMPDMINKLYYSYAVGYNFGLNRDKKINIFVKEYIVAGWIKFFGRKLIFDEIVCLSHFLWGFCLRFFFKPADVNLFMLHGNCLEAIREAKKKKKMVIVEAVNSHPKIVEDILFNEANRVGCGVSGGKINQRDNIIMEASLADYILCPSDAVIDSFLSSGFAADKLIKIPYGSKKRILKNDKIKKHAIERIKILCVGQISIRKGQVNIFESIEGLGNCDVTLVGSADPDYLERLSGYVFEYIKKVDHEKIIDFMRDFDVFVLPSVEDGFAMVVTEAMEAGLPVVVSKYAGASDVVGRCGGGVVVDPTDHEQLRSAIISCAAGEYPGISCDYYSWEDYSHMLSSKINEIYVEWSGRGE